MPPDPDSPPQPLRLVTTTEREDSAHRAKVVQRLEELLQWARDGKITNVAVIAETAEGMVKFTDTGTDSMIEWLGKIEQMKWKMQASYWREDG